MNKQYFVRRDDESGMTLVEVLASIVILSIVITIVFMVFIQSAKTTRMSESVVDATYIGQSEMEKVYTASTEGSMEDWKSQLTNDEAGYEIVGDIYAKQIDDTPFRIEIEIMDHNKHILIRVYEKDADNPKVQMENFYLWEDEAV